MSLRVSKTAEKQKKPRARRGSIVWQQSPSQPCAARSSGTTAHRQQLDDDIGRIMETIRTEVPNTIVTVTADNGAWQDAYPDAGTTPFRGGDGVRGRMKRAGLDLVAGTHSGRRAMR
jgi:hypothetical protein